MTLNTNLTPADRTAWLQSLKPGDRVRIQTDGAFRQGMK